MKSYLFSSLCARYASADVASFSAEQPHDWLLWEPGEWKAPRQQTVSLKVATAPGLRINTEPPRKPSGEALVIALDKKPFSTLGRAESNDLVINDGTLSATHLAFTNDEQGWAVADAGSRNGSYLDGVALGITPQRLTDGSKLRAASVVLTFHTPAGLLARIKP